MFRLLSAIILLLPFLYSCEKDTSSPPKCKDEPTFYEYPYEYEWTVPYQMGDSIKFKLSKRHIVDSGKYEYVFLKNIEVSMVDTFVDTTIQSYANGECIELYWSIRKYYHFEGDTAFNLVIQPHLGGAHIVLYLRGKEFHQSVLKIDKGGEDNFRPFYYLNGNWYPSVNLSAGYKEGRFGWESSYIDSTVMFYNLPDGIIRAIVDDKYNYELTP